MERPSFTAASPEGDSGKMVEVGDELTFAHEMRVVAEELSSRVHNMLHQAESTGVTPDQFNELDQLIQVYRRVGIVYSGLANTIHRYTKAGYITTVQPHDVED